LEVSTILLLSKRGFLLAISVLPRSLRVPEEVFSDKFLSARAILVLVPEFSALLYFPLSIKDSRSEFLASL